MVRSIKLVGLAFVAVLALGALAANSASATPLIHFTAEGSFTGTSGEAKLETLAGHLVTCKKNTDKGAVTGSDKAHVLIEFEECAASGLACTTTEGGGKVGTTGNIHVLALALLGSDTAPPLDLPALLISTENKANELKNTTFECGTAPLSAKLEVRNSVIGLAKNIVLSGGKCGILLVFAKNGTGMQQDTKFWDESETNVEDFLETKSEGALTFGFEGSSEETTATLESGNNILIAT